MLDAALAAGHEATVDVARRVCGGQPAMASLWNLCAAALADFVHPGRYALRRAEVERAPDSLTRAATAALVDALQGSTHARVLTLSHSGSVARVLTALSGALTLEVICGESLPGGEGAALAGQLRQDGIRTELVHDALLTTYLGSASAPAPRSASASGSVAVVMGADAVTAEHWTNKAGTYGLAAAAWFSGVPVYVLASRDKTAAAALALRLSVARPVRTHARTTRHPIFDRCRRYPS